MVQPVPLLPTYPVSFPDPRTALDEPEGLLAAGGALTPEWIIEAYALGIFPWFERDDEPIFWWCPAERGVIEPGKMRGTRSLAKRLRNRGCSITFDQRFSDVMLRDACAIRRHLDHTAHARSLRTAPQWTGTQRRGLAGR